MQAIALRTALIVVGLGLLEAGPAAAPGRAENPQPAIDLTELSLEQLMDIPVLAAARREQKTSEAASSVTIITASEIRTHGWRTLAEILNAVPGLYMSYDRAYHYIGVRGFGRPGDFNTRVLILLNGVRVNEPLFDNGGAGNDAIVDLETIERVEVVRGPSSSLYGTNALLAVVNIITPSGAQAAGGRVSAAYGSYDALWGRLSYGQRLNSGLEFLVSASGARSAGQDFYFPAFDAPETNNGRAEGVDHERFGNVFARLAWGAWNYQFAWTDRIKHNPTGYYGTIFNDRDSRDHDEKILSSLAYGRDVTEHLDLQATLAHQYYAYAGYFPVDVSAAQDGSERVVNQDRARAEWWSVDLKGSTTVLPRNRITAGIEYRDNYRLDQENRDSGAAEASWDDRRSSAVAGLYAEDEIEVSRRARLIGGVRFDWVGLSGEERSSPRAGLILSPWSGGTLKLMYGKAFRSPNPFELYYNDNGFSTKSNPHLVSEAIRTYETVVEQRLGERLFGSAALFRYQIEDLISQTLDSEDGLLQFNNIDQAETKGGELSLRCQLTDAIVGAFSYSYADARDATTDKWLSNSPRHLGKARLSGPCFWPQLWAGVELLYESDRRTLGGNTTGDVAIANVNISCRDVVKNWDFSLAVYNALDESYGVPAGAEHTQDEIPADGRAFRTKAVFRF